MLVLASSSPRRRELLTQAGFEFQILPSSVCEDTRPGERAVDYVLRLAREKAEAVAGSTELGALHRRCEEPLLILGADTTVVAPSGEILAKPEGDADAARMLRKLSGATHQVITGVCLLAGDIVETAAAITWVTMFSLSDEQIDAYIASGEPRGKAGAYAIQGRAALWIPRIHGCYFNVVGLPLALVSSMIEGVQARQGTTAEMRT